MLRHCRDFSFTEHHSYFTARSRPALLRKVLPCNALTSRPTTIDWHRSAASLQQLRLLQDIVVPPKLHQKPSQPCNFPALYTFT